MSEISTSDVIGQVLAVLGEAFEGPPEGQRWSYFTDLGEKAGLFGTLRRSSAAEASRPIGGTSIAAHANHVAFGLEVAADWIRGGREPWNWRESWSVREVDEEGWARLQDRLRERYADLRRAIEEDAVSGPEALGGAIGAVAHAACHLGAIRQKVLIAGGSG